MSVFPQRKRRRINALIVLDAPPILLRIRCSWVRDSGVYVIFFSSSSSGWSNEASGGYNRSVTGINNWRAGGYIQDF